MIEKYNETVDLDCKMTTGTITNCKQSDNEVAFGMFKARNWNFKDEIQKRWQQRKKLEPETNCEKKINRKDS